MKALKNLWGLKEKTSSHKAPFLFASSYAENTFSYTGSNRLASLDYEQNVIVYRCVNLIARSIASVPLCILSGGKQLEMHPVLSLLKQPNPMQSGKAFMEALISFLLLQGNAYVEGLFPEAHLPPVELYALRPDRLSVLPGDRGLPKGYVYRVQNQKRTIPVDCVTGRSSLLHIRFFHPRNDWHGLSPLEAARQSIKSHSTVAKHNLALLENGGRPSGALFLKNTGPRGLTESQREELRSSLKHLYRGSENAGQMMVLEGDVAWKEMGFSPKDMDFNQGKSIATREIAQAFGVPPMLVGVAGDATFSNYKEARLHLWEDTLLPLLDHVINEMNTWLLPAFEGTQDASLIYDADAIPSLAFKRDMKWEQLNNCGFLTLNEKRASLGYGPVQGGDCLAVLKQNREQSA